jgi:hypothetical protein
VKTRSVLRTTLRLSFFSAWLAIGFVAVAVCFLGGAGDTQIADSGLDFQSGAPAPVSPQKEPAAAPESSAEQPSTFPHITGTADIDTGGGLGKPASAFRVSEESLPDGDKLWAGMSDEAIGDNLDASKGLNFSGTGSGGGGSGVGRIGLGNVGTIGKGGGNTEGHGYGSGKAATRPKKVSVKPPIIKAEPSVAAKETDLDSDVDQKLADLPLGNIAFNTPESIPFGDSARIELLVSLKQAEEELRRAVRAEGPVETARVKISDQMEARLTGLGFRIEAITPERQALTRGEPTQWQWQIEPNKSATLELHLTLSALIEVDGVPATRAVRTFERTIYVEVPLVSRVSDFLAGHLELLMSFVLIPVAGGTFRYVRNQRKRGSQPPDQAPPAKQAA